MSDEMTSLLLDSLQPRARRVTEDRLASLTDAQWQALVSLATAHQVPELFYERLRSRGIDTLLPPGLSATLVGITRRTALRNLGMYAELRSIVTPLAADGIPVIVLKGAHLAGAVYDTLALRQMVDLDLLVPPAALRRAAAVVEARGYRSMAPCVFDLAGVEDSHLPTFRKPGSPNVEIHWRLSPASLNIGPHELWDRAMLVRLAGVDALGLCVEDLLLNLCTHWAYKHHFAFGLKGACDIAITLDRFGPSVSWRDVVERARRWRAAPGVYAALRLARDLVGAAVPDDLLLELRPASFKDATLAMARMQTLTDRTIEGAIRGLPTTWGRNGMMGKIRELQRHVFVPTAELARRHGVPADSPAIYFWYAVRLRYLLVRYWRNRRMMQGIRPSPGET